ncbi:hypothetical protein, partial [Xanthomonas perforans]|uniref:hypothetical protein n=1 Tax=Xanthomonas perforans TaxID=442694 RepID=UPI001F179FD7
SGQWPRILCTHALAISAKNIVERPVIVLVATRKRLAHVPHFKIMKKAPPLQKGRQSSCALQ